MKELNKIQNAIFLFGGILMAVGAGTSLLGWGSSPYIYALGALGFASMQMLQRYEGSNFTWIRNVRMNTAASFPPSPTVTGPVSQQAERSPC